MAPLSRAPRCPAPVEARRGEGRTEGLGAASRKGPRKKHGPAFSGCAISADGGRVRRAAARSSQAPRPGAATSRAFPDRDDEDGGVVVPLELAEHGFDLGEGRGDSTPVLAPVLAEAVGGFHVGRVEEGLLPGRNSVVGGPRTGRPGRPGSWGPVRSGLLAARRGRGRSIGGPRTYSDRRRAGPAHTAPSAVGLRSCGARRRRRCREGPRKAGARPSRGIRPPANRLS